MKEVDFSQLSKEQQETYDALVMCAGDVDQTSKLLGVSKDVVRKRVSRLDLSLSHFQTQPTADTEKEAQKMANTSKNTKKRSRPKKGEKPKTERYERKDGPVVVQEGATRLISVEESHPAAQAKNLTVELGGEAKPTPSGLKLHDKEGRCFAIVGSIGKKSISFYAQRVEYKTAKSVAPDLGEWSYCWPKKKEGCATLVKIEKVTKGMLRNLMKLHASHQVDRRKKGDGDGAKNSKKGQKAA